jgi:L-threonylcarbamoyladenylate synthase
VGARIVSAAEGMAEAVECLRSGGLVVFPTETVYGLGANALDPDAVARIFAAKGRPSTNPLIVHVPEVAAARELADEWPATADKLAAQFWPGPLTLVVRKAAVVPNVVTAGGPTVGLRVPNHPVALELLRSAGVPIAAPSANRSEEVSPTTAQHVADSLGPYTDDLLILDGGPCTVGVESTVLDVTSEPPHILRPGMVTEAMLRQVIMMGVGAKHTRHGVARSPGQMVRHYAPKASVVPVSRESWAGEFRAGDGVVFCGSYPPRVRESGDRFRFLPAEPHVYARSFYAMLRDLDASGVSRILIVRPPDTPEWAAIHDRLRRAAAPKA